MSPIYCVDTKAVEPLDNQIYRNGSFQKKWDIPAVRASTNQRVILCTFLAEPEDFLKFEKQLFWNP